MLQSTMPPVLLEAVTVDALFDDETLDAAVELPPLAVALELLVVPPAPVETVVVSADGSDVRTSEVQAAASKSPMPNEAWANGLRLT